MGRPDLYKLKQMLGEGTHPMDDSQAGCFQKTFMRMWAGESYSDPISMVRQYCIKLKRKNLSGPFRPSNDTKKP